MKMLWVLHRTTFGTRSVAVLTAKDKRTIKQTDTSASKQANKQADGHTTAGLFFFFSTHRRNTEAAKHLREASTLLDESITAAAAAVSLPNKPTKSVGGENSAAASASGLKSALVGVLASLGMSLLLMENDRSDDRRGLTPTDPTGSDHTGGGGSSGEHGASAEGGAVVEDDLAQREREEAVTVLARALELFNAEAGPEVGDGGEGGEAEGVVGVRGSAAAIQVGV